MEAGIGAMLPQAKEHLGPPHAGKGQERILPERLQREQGLVYTLIMELRLQNARE